MKKQYIFSLVIVGCSSILLSCAAPQTDPDAAYEEPSRRAFDCISQMSIRDYYVLDDANLIVTGTGKRKYHVTLFRRAYGLRSTWRIGFRSPTGQVCAGSGELIFDDGLGADSVKVRSVRALTPDEHEELLVQFGKKEPDTKQTPEPEEVDGAEVEELD